MDEIIRTAYNALVEGRGFTTLNDDEDGRSMYRREENGFSIVLDIPRAYGADQNANVTFLLDLGREEGDYGTVDNGAVGDMVRAALPFIDREIEGDTYSTLEGMDLNYSIPIRSEEDVIRLVGYFADQGGA